MKLIFKKITALLALTFLSITLSSCAGAKIFLSAIEYDKRLQDFSYIDENTKRQIEEDRLRSQLNMAEKKIDGYEDLISNLNDYLKSVYYGKANKGPDIIEGFTAFSISYKGKYYLVTAGHCVGKDDNRIYNNHQFKQNFDDGWIMPFLLTFDSGKSCSKDYAVFRSPHITFGLDVDPYYEDDETLVLGNNFINTLRQNNTGARQGESGSPIISLEGKVVGLLTAENGGYTDISLVLEKIDDYESKNKPVFSENFHRLYKTLLDKANQDPD